MTKFQINIKDQTSPFPHYWEQCVGSCHGYTALREDYRQQLKKAHEELGFQYVRFHGLFDDDMCVCVENKGFHGESLGIVYNFLNVDNIFDFLLSIGMKPFIELGFMPSCLASGEQTVFHYKGNITPPEDYKKWNQFIEAFVRHLLERYGEEEVKSWFFEVWNEPNLAIFFSGSQEDYFELYENTARTIKEVEPSLRVGGPATSINTWLPEMVEFCEKNNVPLDFLTTHHYPTDDPLWRNTDLSVQEFFEKFGSEFGKYERGVLKEMTKIARQEAGKYPLYYTEWNVSGILGEESHDECYAAATVAKILADNDGLVQGYSFWTFTDIFEEMSQTPGAFHGGFGLQTVYGVEKPVYRVFQLFHWLGEKRLPVVSSNPEANVEILATKAENSLRLLVFNHNVPEGEMQSEKIQIQIEGIEQSKKITAYRIDEEHANSKKAWVEMGRPKYLLPAQIDQLHESSRLKAEKSPEKLEFLIPEHGVLYMEIEL